MRTDIIIKNYDFSTNQMGLLSNHLIKGLLHWGIGEATLRLSVYKYFFFALKIKLLGQDKLPLTIPLSNLSMTPGVYR